MQLYFDIGVDFWNTIVYNILMGHKRGDAMSSKKMGRPIVGERKDIDVKVRFDKTTNERLLKYCKEHGITRTEAIRQGVHLLLANENK